MHARSPPALGVCYNTCAACRVCCGCLTLAPLLFWHTLFCRPFELDVFQKEAIIHMENVRY